jgi:hypothetical protein
MISESMMIAVSAKIGSTGRAKIQKIAMIVARTTPRVRLLGESERTR